MILFSISSVLLGTLFFLFLLIGLPIIIIVCSTKKNKNNKPSNNIEHSVLLKYCSHCGAEINECAAVCLKCGCAINRSQSYNTSLDEPSAGLNILSFFIPLVGLILYLAFQNTPRKARSCGKCALIGFVIPFVLFFVVTLIYINA